MPVFNCDAAPGLSVIRRPDDCAKKNTVSQAAWFRMADIDRDNIATGLDACGATIVTGLPLIAGATLYKINLDSDTTSWSSSYSVDNGYYEWSFTSDFVGLTADMIEAICEAQALCDIGLWLRFGCKELIFGITYNNGVFEANYRGEVTAHDLSGGAGNDSVNSLTIGGKMDCAATCADIGYDNLTIEDTTC